MRDALGIRTAMIAVAAMLLLLSVACGATETIEVPGETIVVEKEVIKEVMVPGETVVVEKVVTETVEVPGETVVQEVIKEVQVPGETVVVEKEVVKEVAVPGETVVVETEVVKTVEVPGETVVVEKEVVRTVEVPMTPMMEEPRYGGTLTWMYWPARGGDVSNWDPFLSGHGSRAATPYAESLLMGDISRGPRGTNEHPFNVPEYTPEPYLVGLLAESWEASLDTIVFNLRQGIYFTGNSVNSGVGERREFVAQDVKAVLEHSFGHPRCGWMTEFIDNIETPDKYTAKLNLKHYNSSWPFNIAYGYCGQNRIIPQEVRDAGSEDWKNQYGTGPFLLTDYVPGSSVTYEKNPDYWRTETIGGTEYGLPFVDKMVAPIIPDETTQLAAIRTGAIELLSLVPTRYRVTLADTAPDLQRRSQVAGNGWQIAYKHEEGQLLPVEPFTDLRVRKAMSMAIDRQGLVDSLFLGVGDILTYPISPAAGPMYTPVEELPPAIREFFDYDPEEAKQLLSDAGYPDGFETELWTVAPVDDMYQAVVAYWAAIGIDAKLVPIERGAIGALYSSKDYPQMLSASGGSTVNPLSDMESFVNVGANLNVANYNDLLLNDKMTAALRTNVIAEWTRLFDEMNIYYLEKWPAFGLPRPHLDYWWWPRLKNYYGEVDMSYFDSGIVGAIVWLGDE